MRYRSTRGETPPLSFQDAVLTGQAPDGGLLIPERIPDVGAELRCWAALTYPELALAVLRPFVDDVAPEDLARMIAASYAGFDHPEVSPVVPLGSMHLLELFHGPTLAFKDLALQLLGRLFEHILAARGETLNILGATSGDTGSAGIAGVRGRAGLRIFVMFPDGRTSAVQERQMTTVLDENVSCLAIQGSFDDCQGLMKAIFGDLAFKERYRLGAVNSINWARLLAQVVYYFYAYFRVRPQAEGPVSFSVPTGNFGDIFAGYLARRMGLPVDRLILATNENDILRVFFATGRYRRGDVRYTLSPSMDIQVASNLERYLYYRLGEDPARLRAFMERFAAAGEARLEPEDGDEVFVAGSADRAQTLATIRRCYAEHGQLLDPHTAVGVSVAERAGVRSPVVCLATAHPAKFPEAIEEALGAPLARHPAIDALAGKETRRYVLPPRVDAVKAFIAERVGEG